MSPTKRENERLPESGSVEDGRYRRHVRRKIEQGLEDVKAGRTLSEEEFDRRMARWFEAEPGAGNYTEERRSLLPDWDASTLLQKAKELHKPGG
jgi:hypothetical protein